MTVSQHRHQGRRAGRTLTSVVVDSPLLVASRLAPASAASLSALLAWAALSPPPLPHTSALAGVLAVVALLAAVRMGTTRCMESRVAAAAVAFVTVLGVTLASSVGLPGAAPRPVDVPAVVLALTALAVLALAAAPAPPRGAEDAPYAS